MGEKGYFYPIDEPGDSAAYERYREITERLARLCPGYNMVTPFNTDEVKINGNKISSVKLQKGRSSILCGLSDVVGRGSTLEEMTNAAKTAAAHGGMSAAPPAAITATFSFIWMRSSTAYSCGSRSR